MGRQVRILDQDVLELFTDRTVEEFSCRRCWAVAFLRCRKVHITIEQPLTSLLFHTPEFEALQGIVQMTRFVTWLGAFGYSSAKPVAFYTSHIEAPFYLVRTRKDAQERVGASKKPLFTEAAKSQSAASSSGASTTWRKDKWVNGDKEKMSASSEYPEEFAERLAYVFFSHFKHATRVYRGLNPLPPTQFKSSLHNLQFSTPPRRKFQATA